MVEEKRLAGRGIEFWVMLLLSVVAWAPATYPGYWRALDGFIPLFNSVHLQRLATIATTPDRWRGDGVAAFLLPNLLYRLSASPESSVRISFIIIFVVASAGAYFWLKRHWGERGAALGGLLYILLPPFLATVYIRGALADATVLALHPWLFVTLDAISQAASTRNRLLAALLFALLSIWLWLTQAGLALLATLPLLGYALWVQRNRFVTISALVGMLLALATFLPIRDITNPSPIHFADHFVYLFQLFGKDWQVAPSIPGWQDGYPFQLGLICVLLSILTSWFWWGGSWESEKPLLAKQQRRFLGFAAVTSLFGILLSLQLSVWFWQITAADQLLTYPWQVIIVSAPLLVILPAALPTLLPAFQQTQNWTALLLLIVAGSSTFLTTDFTNVEPPLQPVAVVGENQLVLLEAEIDKGDPPTVTLQVGWQVIQPLVIDYNVFIQARSDESAQAVTVAQFDGAPLSDRPATSWQPGEIFTTTFNLHLENNVAIPELYYFGFYDWRDGKRLPFDGGRDDKLVLRQ